MSNRFELNREDLKKWLNNAAVFLAPAALIFLVEINSGHTLEQALIAIKVWALSTAIDLLRKFIAGS